MALKSEYNATRGDAKHLARNVRPGDRLYVIHDIARNIARYEDAQLYSEYIVTSKRAIASNQLTVAIAEDPSGQGVESVGGLLARNRTVYTQPPAGIRNITESRQVATDQQVGSAATRAMNRALEEDRKNRRQPVAAGKKRSCF